MSDTVPDLKIGVIPLGEIVGDTSTESEVSRVVQAIMRTVDPASWIVGGGFGTIVAMKLEFDKVWRLTILNTEANIKTIGNLTIHWRDAKKVVTGQPIIEPPLP